MQEVVPLVSSTTNSIYSDQDHVPTLLLRQYIYCHGKMRFGSSRMDFHNNSTGVLPIPNNFESETLARLDEILSQHSAMFLPFYVVSMVLAFMFSLVGSALPTFIACLYVLLFNEERRRKLRMNLQAIIDQQNEMYFKPKGLLLVLQNSGLLAKFDLGGSWKLNVMSNSTFIDNGIPSMKILECVATNDAKSRLFGEELPQCISEKFSLSQTEWSQTIDSLNRIYLTEIEMEERLISTPLYWYLFACSLLFNIPILVTFPFPIIYYFIVKYLKVNKLKQSNQIQIDSLIQERNERIFSPKGLRLHLHNKKQIVGISTPENILKLCIQ